MRSTSWSIKCASSRFAALWQSAQSVVLVLVVGYLLTYVEFATDPRGLSWWYLPSAKWQSMHDALPCLFSMNILLDLFGPVPAVVWQSAQKYVLLLLTAPFTIGNGSVSYTHL